MQMSPAKYQSLTMFVKYVKGLSVVVSSPASPFRSGNPLEYLNCLNAMYKPCDCQNWYGVSAPSAPHRIPAWPPRRES
jgi:hypothetical protein